MFSVSVGVPVTMTGSLKLIVIGTTWPTVYEPLARVEVTELTVGAVTSVLKPIAVETETGWPEAAKRLFELVTAAWRALVVTSASSTVLLIPAAPEPVLSARYVHGAIPVTAL